MQVQAITRRSSRQAAELLARAFLNEPVSQRVYRGLTAEQQLKNLTVDFAGELRVGLRRGEPLEICQDGKLVAAALIYPPGSYPLGWWDERLIQISTIFGHTPYDLGAWQAWLDEVEKLHPQTPHYYLQYLGVEPALQGRGLGSRLLEEVVRRADVAGMGCYLETATQRNVLLYQRYGFEVTSQKEIIGLPVWLMWRCPLPALPQIPRAGIWGRGESNY